MPSPFPGMDPYIEQDDVWHDFHDHFISHAAGLLVAQVRPNYIVKIDEHLYIHEVNQETKRLLGRADIAVGAGIPLDSGSAESRGIIAPVEVVVPGVDVERLSYLEIRDRRDRELITAIELLSPSNKRPGADRNQYLAKRGQILAGSSHFVEIDLLRGGIPTPAFERPACDYAVMVSRAEERPKAGFWPIALRGRLPVIPIPLRAGDPDAHLDLQAVLDFLYDFAGYADYIHDGEPDPPLADDDAAWARSILAAL